jgi:hypothetical protein
MPLPVIADVIRVSVEGHCANQHQWANVIHYRKSGAITFAAAIAILDPILLNLYTVNSGAGQAWRGMAPPAAGLERMEYTPLDGTTATTVIQHVSAGGSAFQELPASVCLVTTLRTARRGRSYRGRVYWGPSTEDYNVAPGVPQSTLVVANTVQWTAHITALGGSGVSLVVASYLHSTAENVTTVSTDSRWDTQRRRLNA